MLVVALLLPLLSAQEPALPPAGPPPSPPTRVVSGKLWFLGVLIMCLGTTTQALGANLQRLSARREASKPSGTQRPARKQPLFVLGVILLVGAGIFSSTSLVFASQSVLAPLILLIFIANPIFSHAINSEPFNWYTDGTCTALIIGSVGLVVSYAPPHAEEASSDHVKYLLTQPTFFTFISLTAALILTAYGTKRRIYLRLGRDWSKLSTLWERTVVHVSFGMLGGAFGGLNVSRRDSNRWCVSVVHQRCITPGGSR